MNIHESLSGDETLARYVESAIRECLSGTLAQCVTDQKAQQLLFLLASTLMRQRHEQTHQRELDAGAEDLLETLGKTFELPAATETPAAPQSRLSRLATALQLDLENPLAAPALSRILKADHAANAQREAAFVDSLKQTLAGARPQAGKLPENATDKLALYLRAVFPDEKSLVVKSLRPIPGGLSKTTVVVELEGARALPTGLVVRMDMPESPLCSTVRNEFDLLRTVYEHGVAVPRPFAVEASGEVWGAPFMLVEQVAGKPVGDTIDVYGAPASFGLDMARQFARLHSIPVDRFGSSLYGAEVSTRDRMLREISECAQRWQRVAFDSPSMSAALVWLERNVSLAEGPRSLIHRDTGCHNILEHGGAVTAILDWETTAAGCFAQDLGYVRDQIVQFMDWSAFIDAYVAAGGHRPPQASIDYYSLWGYVWVCVMAAQSRHDFMAGLAPSIQAAFAGEHILRRYLFNISKKMSQL